MICHTFTRVPLLRFNRQVCSEPSDKADTDNGHHFYAQQICTTKKPVVPPYSFINGQYAWSGTKVPRLKRLCNFARDGLNAHYPILTEAECKKAATALKRTYASNGNWCPNSPPGCYRNSDTSNFWCVAVVMVVVRGIGTIGVAVLMVAQEVVAHSGLAFTGGAMGTVMNNIAAMVSLSHPLYKLSFTIHLHDPRL